ncbi:hypothetical protein FH969_00155 [Miniimonas arenae]|uniref:Uncharacterized protein n=1 Tax=Miniimonas arenae TaxID=676201 RepID=A0A5C5BG20_9MICO|nr:hypothetical protein [Miniimonas arenae]TNU77230.1 hypothetical protein FH969_00155 [Miniimonas arenae]
MTREPGDPRDDLPDWPDDVVIPDDLSALLGDTEGTTADQASAAGSPPAGVEPRAASAPAAAPSEGADAAGRADLRDGGTAAAADAGPAEGEAADPIVRTTAVVLTSVRQAKVLAGVLALTGIEAAVVPSARGALAVRYVEQAAADVDPAEALSGIPREAEALGAALSVATRSEVVLLAARVDEVDGEIAGQVKARRYRGGQVADEPPPGLVLAQADQVAERLLIGLVQAPEVPGYVSSADLAKPAGRSFFGRRRKGGDDA